ncbi:MAG: DUF721 domain-containing protein [Candidatus Omnitrophica bacterium]|nr:DUF721 domain-containing protein [Candidatus Omnitrophota bacterium]
MMRNQKPVHIQEVIGKFLQGVAEKKESPQLKIMESWEKIVCAPASTCSAPVMLKNKVLTVVVSNSAWLHQLTMQRRELVEKIDALIGPDLVADIRFKIGNPTMA